MSIRSLTALLLILGQLGLPPAFTAPQQSRPPSDWAEASDLWLRAQVTPNRLVAAPEPARRRLLLSYQISPKKDPRFAQRSATYDDALAALAFLVKGDTDSSAFILHALSRLVRADGSLWFSYDTSDDWPSETDHESAIVRAGAVAWVGYALTFYLKHAPACVADKGCTRERALFSASAVRLAEYLITLQVNKPSDPRDGLIRLGRGTLKLTYNPQANDVVEVYSDVPAMGISTENNISTWFFLRQQAELTGQARWSEAANRIQRGLLTQLWNDQAGQFDEGFKFDGSVDHIRALDCASWGALFLLATGETQKARRALQATTDYYYSAAAGDPAGYRPYFDSPVYEDPQVGSFFFPNEPRTLWRALPVVWSEGTLGVALGWLHIGDPGRAQQLVQGLKPLKLERSTLRCASLEVKFQMSDVPCVAASTWLILLTEAISHNPLAEQMWK